MTLSYDAAADVLYVTFERSAESPLYVENENGDVLRIDPKSRVVVGCTIPAFSKRASEAKVSIPEVGVVPMNHQADELISIVL